MSGLGLTNTGVSELMLGDGGRPSFWTRDKSAADL
jgi:hypothetical protein